MPKDTKKEKESVIKKTTPLKSNSKKTNTIKKTTPIVKNKITTKTSDSKTVSKNQSTEKEINLTKNIKEKNKAKVSTVPREILEKPNTSPIFDVFLYRELFMSLRSQLDALYEKRERSDKDFEAYDDAVYNVTVNAVDNAGAQDFLSYCYKRGKYDFCLINFEKFMKWSLLSAANGNAFALSKLQIFLTSSIDSLLSSDVHSYIIGFLELSNENYIMFLSKLICEEMVKLLEISSTTLIKMPEVYLEQNEQLQRSFDNAKIKATENVTEFLRNLNNQLKEYVDSQIEEEKKLKREFKKETESKNKSNKKTSSENHEKEEELEKSKLIKRTKKAKIKKFRW